MTSSVLKMEELHCSSRRADIDSNRRNSARKRRLSVRRKILLIVVMAAAAVFLSLYIGMTSSDAHDLSSENSQIRNRYYQQVVIKSGDTLWNIAADHMTEEYSSVNEYVDDIISVNKLSSDNIHAGEYLIVPYYR